MKNKDINSVFGLLDLLKEYDYNRLYNRLIYGSDIIDSNKDALSLLYDKIDYVNKKALEDMIIIEQGLEINNVSLAMKLSFLVNLDNVDSVVSELLGYLKKKKIKYSMTLSIKNDLCYVCINILDREYLIKLIDYINDKLGKRIECVNPLIFSDNKVCLSFDLNYSYNEVLVMYLDKFLKCEKNINYNSFKKFILDNYFRITNQIDMYKFIEFNKKDIELSRFFKNIDIMTTLIVYLINEKDIEDYCDYFKKLNKEENKKINVYNIYDDLSSNKDLFRELVSSMYFKYGLEYSKNSIINYMNTGKKMYITRVNDLRKRVTDAKSFMIYLYKIDFDLEFDKVIYECELDGKKKILENVCRETYLNCNDCEKLNSGKIHIARTLIRISCGDYSSITRNNDARKMARENIKPCEVVSLIKDTLKIDYVKKEATLYELYAEYIVNLCVV